MDIDDSSAKKKQYFVSLLINTANPILLIALSKRFTKFEPAGDAVCRGQRPPRVNELGATGVSEVVSRVGS